MAQMPVEVVEIGDLAAFDIGRALSLANSLQDEFVYLKLQHTDARLIEMHAFQEIYTPVFFKTMEGFRTQIAGFHPYLIAFVDAYLKTRRLKNLFGDDRPEKGLAVFTVKSVPELIIQPDRMLSYFVYYLAKPTLCFLAPEKKNHRVTRGCVFDKKIQKRHIVKSMKTRALCDKCREELVKRTVPISPSQFEAIDRLFGASGDLLEGRIGGRPRAFIGSSSEGLPIAEQLQRMLADDLSSIVWNQGTVFGLANTTIESLERTVLNYDYGIFVVTPDDRLVSRGTSRDIARDNVIFELGLFMGKLTRQRIVVLQAERVSLPSDLSGFTTAKYDPLKTDLAEGLKLAIQQIKSFLGRAPEGSRHDGALGSDGAPYAQDHSS